MKRKVLWCGLSLLLVAALMLASCGEVEVVGEQEEEEEEAVPGEQEEEAVPGEQEEEAVPGEQEEEAVPGEQEEEVAEEEEPTPATFTIHDLSISPTEIDTGERITISVVATNNGDLTGDYSVIFKINNVAVETMELTMDGGVSQRVDFAATVDYAPETYSVNVNGLLGTFTVKAATPKPLTLNQFLEDNFGTLETSLGPTSFEFDIIKNDSILTPYDYWIQVEYDSGFFYDLKYSIDVTTEMNHTVCKELKAHQEKLARAVMAFMPAEKFYGGYYDSWYRYPTLKVDLITRHYYSWVNYTPAGVALLDYDETTVSDFQWYSLIDDTLLRH